MKSKGLSIQSWSSRRASKPFSPVFARSLRALRVKKGLGVRELAGMLGVTPAYISNIENAVAPPPSSEVAATLARILGQHPEDFIALAGRIPSDLPGIIQSRPRLYGLLLRVARALPDDYLEAQIKKMLAYKKKKGAPARHGGQSGRTESHGKTAGGTWPRR